MDANSARVRQVWSALDLGASIAPSTRYLRSYQLGLWETYSGNPALASITPAKIEEMQTAGIRAGSAPDTINKTVDTVFTVLRGAVERGWMTHIPKRPKRLHSKPTRTRKISLAEFDKFLAALPKAMKGTRGRTLAWWHAFWGTIYLTALRLKDIERLEWDQISECGIEVTQTKTGGLVRLPLHPVLERLLVGIEREKGYSCVFYISRKTLYRITRLACKIAGVPSFTPQSIRILAARQHERAHAGAGRLILGRGFPGCDGYYFDAGEILTQASEKLALPPALLTDKERSRKLTSETALLTTFQGLSVENRETVLKVALSLRR